MERGIFRSVSGFLRASMTRKQGVLRSSKVPTYTPTTSGIASNSLSCDARTALISRFGEGELVWAMFGRQAANRISAKANKAGAYNDQRRGEAASSVSITSLTYEAGCARYSEISSLDSHQFPTIVAPRNESTSSMGFAIAVELLPAKSRPTARGFVPTSSTISDPESPLFRNLLPRFVITI